jgi:hypothetical protein
MLAFIYTKDIVVTKYISLEFIISLEVLDKELGASQL